MKNKTLYTDQYVDVEYDITFDDMLDLIETCDDDEKETIKKMVSGDETPSLYDEQKMNLLKVAFDKYSLDELMEKLQLTYLDY